ncbi:DUF4142 domain-containing protein [Chondromyces crocatus]|uniref:DUF4142 domain-containing protein n=1 Tax=Chondromyces crocatus TaxID=52 RepID=A0A0K1EBN4_CHOCO|nr:DUF4142 domain-containing protein [Chondromyces crocatus]AKT37993.1 uncharacterized protein CMC5_021340 [Chondromyces crocatus]
MRRVWMLAALALLAGCDPGNRGDVIAAEKPQPVAPGQGQPGGVMVFGTVMEDEASATARLLAATAVIAQAGIDRCAFAQRHAASPAVQAFAGKLLATHRRNLAKVHELSRDKHIDVGSMSRSDAQITALALANQEDLRVLRSLSGSALDAAFMAGQPTRQVLIERIAVEGQRVSRDPDLDYFFSDVMSQAQVARDDAMRITPIACGGHPLRAGVMTAVPIEMPSRRDEIPAVDSPDPAVRSALPGEGNDMEVGPRQGSRYGIKGEYPSQDGRPLPRR